MHPSRVSMQHPNNLIKGSLLWGTSPKQTPY